MPTPNEYTRRAIAVLTAHVDDASGERRFGSGTASDIAYEAADPEVGWRQLSIGLTNLSSYLLVRLEAETGLTAGEVLQDAARLHAEG